MNNYNTAICIVGICLVITALVIFINHLRTKKTIDTIENMLNEAAKGNFSEKSFDETRLSSLETRFAHYLSASVVSARNVELEKDKIKSIIQPNIEKEQQTPKIQYFRGFLYILKIYQTPSKHTKMFR